jgi:putative phosphoesterase
LTLLGVISDTHGLLRRAALEALEGVGHIVHAGDVGDPAILPALERIAPVTAVRGNVDLGDWARRLPPTAQLEVGGRWFHVLHALEDLDLEPAAAGFDVVVHGHSHRPSIERRGSVLYLNPGSAGPRRFRLPVVLARVRIDGAAVDAELVSLED